MMTDLALADNKIDAIENFLARVGDNGFQALDLKNDRRVVVLVRSLVHELLRGHCIRVHGNAALPPAPPLVLCDSKIFKSELLQRRAS